MDRLQYDQHNRILGNLAAVDTTLDVGVFGDIHQEQDVGVVGDAGFEVEDNDSYKKSDVTWRTSIPCCLLCSIDVKFWMIVCGLIPLL